MKQQTSTIIKSSNQKLKSISYYFTIYLLIACWCFVSTLKLYGQKNEFGLVYNFTGYNYDEMSDFGFRYARFINPRVSASFSFDNQWAIGRAYHDLNQEYLNVNGRITGFRI